MFRIGANGTVFAAPLYQADLGTESGDSAAPSTDSTTVESSEFMSGEPTDQRRVEIDINKLDDEPDETDPASVPGSVKANETEIPGNATPEDNSKWAQLRRDAEEATRLKGELAKQDKWVEENFGKSHNLHDWKSYQQAVADSQRQQIQQQALSFDQETTATLKQMQEAGYDQISIQLYQGQRDLIKQNQELTQKLSMIENVTQQQTKKQQQEMMDKQIQQRGSKELAELQSEYPEFKSIHDVVTALGEEAFGKLCEKTRLGYSLLDAYESINRQAIKQKTVAATKQKTVNDLNSKKHLKTEGDGATEAASNTALSPETLEMYMDSGMTEKQARSFHKKLYG